MYFRIVQFVLLASAIVSGLVVFLPWEHLPLLASPFGTRCLATKIILLPIPVFFLLGSLWAAERARAHHG